MSGHPDLRPLLQDDAPGDRHEALEHIRGCTRCRAEVARDDPSRLFALLALEPVPEALLQRLSRNVDDAVDRELADRLPLRRWGIASLAASILLAGFFSTYLWTRGRPTGAPPLGGGVDLVEHVDAGPEGPLAPPAVIEVSSPGTAQVLDLSVGDTQLVMIFDKALDI
jgi:hypothetical protein